MTKFDDQPASDDRLEQRSREMFDASVADLDAPTRSRLNQARQAALDAHGQVSANPMRWLLPVGGAAALGLMAVTAVQFMRADDAAPSVEQANAMGGAVDDLEIIASSEELEMLKDVDFYAWLETQQESLVDGTGEAG